MELCAALGKKWAVLHGRVSAFPRESVFSQGCWSVGRAEGMLRGWASGGYEARQPV